MRNNNNLITHDQIVNAFTKGPNGVAQAAHYYLALLELEKQKISTGVTRQSLNETSSGGQNHTAAEKDFILSKAAASTAFTLSAIGKELLNIPGAKNHFDQAKWAAASALKADDKEEREKAKKDAKKRLMEECGIVTMAKPVMCQGCGNNSTKNRDKFGKSYCMRSKACKAEAQAHYATQGIEVEMSSAPATPAASSVGPTKRKGKN
jgi:hypothetical protein